MADRIQILRRIGACENKQAQPEWKGPAIDPCPAPAVFLCESCGRMLCGSHAGGHWHEASTASAIASHFQEEATLAQANAAAAAKNAEGLQAQLDAARAQGALVEKIKALVG